MFGRPQDEGTGPQVRGFGFLHDGSIDTIFRFLGASVFDLTNAEQRRLEQFALAFDSNFAPIVGQQATIHVTSSTNVSNRVDLILARADLGECDVVVRGIIAGELRGGFRLPDGTFQMDREDEAPMLEADFRLLALNPGQEMTYTCVPPGSGLRIGIDRDEDTFFDRDEIDDGTDPADPTDFPGSAAVAIRASTFKLRDDARAPIDPSRKRLTFRSAKYRGAQSGVVVPAWDSAGDPTSSGATGGGGTLTIFRADGSSSVEIPLPAANWKRIGSATKPGYRYRDADRSDGPISTITLRSAKLIIRGKGAELYPLAGAPQGEMALRLQLASDSEMCTSAPARQPTAKHDTTAKFNGDRTIPAGCPRVP
jgi:hypothetical protein